VQKFHSIRFGINDLSTMAIYHHKIQPI